MLALAWFLYERCRSMAIWSLSTVSGEKYSSLQFSHTSARGHSPRQPILTIPLSVSNIFLGGLPMTYRTGIHNLFSPYSIINPMIPDAGSYTVTMLIIGKRAI